jgi:hypothetical protein
MTDIKCLNLVTSRIIGKFPVKCTDYRFVLVQLTNHKRQKVSRNYQIQEVADD